MKPPSEATQDHIFEMSLKAPLLISNEGEGDLVNGIKLHNILGSGYADAGEVPQEPRDADRSDRQLEYSAEHDTLYDDFHTIDWVRDRNRDKERHRKMKERQQMGWKAWCNKKWTAMSGWVIVFLVGVCSGILAGVIDVGAAWMSDLKEGICVSWPYYDREACCWLSNQTSFNVDHCDDWKTWAEQGGTSDTSSYKYSFSWLGYGVYIIFAVFFSGLAGFFVVMIAPYAAGSGIPEVCHSVCCINGH